MQNNYYFLAASFPPLVLGEAPEITFEEFSFRLQVNLKPEDLEKTRILRRPIDLFNIRSHLCEEAIDSRGNLSEKELDEALLVRHILPEYVFTFLDRYDSLSDRLGQFDELLAAFYSEEVENERGFLFDYLMFEGEWRFITAALRAKSIKRDITKELAFADPSGSLVTQIFSQKDQEEYHPPAEYTQIKELISSCGNDPMERAKLMVEYRLQMIETLVTAPLFTMDWILGYMARLMIVQQWHELDHNQGMSILETFKNG